MDAPGYGAGRRSVNYTSELTHIALTGTGGGFERNSDGDRNLATLSGKTWCTNAKTCKCPPNTRRAGEEFEKLVGGNRTIALSGGPSGAQVVVSGTSLEEECNRRSCMIGTWRLNGPPTGPAVPIKSGGTGAVLTISPDGAATYDFTPSQKVVIGAPNLTYEIKYNGTATATVTFPKDPNGGAGSFTNADTSGLSAADILINGSRTLSGIPTQAIADGVTKAFGQNLFSPDGAFEATCTGNQLSLGSSVSRVTFTKI